MSLFTRTPPRSPAPTNSRGANRLRTRWAAIGAAVAVTLGAGALATVDAARSSGERTSYFPITPCRLADTRPDFQVGLRSSPLGPGETATFEARGAVGQCDATDLPTDASALALNVTAVSPTVETFLTFWPSGDRPNSSSLNPLPGQGPTPNAVTVLLDGAGRFRVFNNVGSVHIVIDVVGFHADHHHDDRYLRPRDRVLLEFADATANFGGMGIGLGDPSSADDLAEVTIDAPASGGQRLVVATATVHVNTLGDQSSSWSIDATPAGGSTSALAARDLYVVSAGLSTNPSDTITFSDSFVQDPGESHTLSVSGERNAGGVPLANVRVELHVVSTPLGTG